MQLNPIGTVAIVLTLLGQVQHLERDWVQVYFEWVMPRFVYILWLTCRNRLYTLQVYKLKQWELSKPMSACSIN